ncbi:MAG: DUF1707 domain-containing protein [Candidatus Nanopelagicales bacterium]|nr:DUF1707 domain-containing protein [Candidatus Nanopelagicales bacterium]
MSLSEIPPGPADGPLGAAGRVLVSDADRARMADVIGDAFAEGRLNREEYEERLTATMGARTAAELVPVLEGLPPATVAAALAPLTGMAMALPPQPAPAPAPGWHPPAGVESSSSSVVAVFGGATRKGEWVVPAQLTAFAMFGGVELDLRHCTFAQAESEIIAVAVMGGIEITVPEGLTVHVDGTGIFGGFDQNAEGPGQPGAPVLRVKGAALFGGVEVKRKPRKKGVGGSDRPQLPER